MRCVKLNENNVVIAIEEWEIKPPGYIQSNSADFDDTYSNGEFIKPIITLTQEELVNIITASTQRKLDEFAKTRNYDGILSACTYANSSIDKFKIEGQYCIDQRDLVWNTLYEIMAQVLAGTRPMPSGFVDIESSLPILSWPN